MGHRTVNGGQRKLVHRVTRVEFAAWGSSTHPMWTTASVLRCNDACLSPIHSTYY